MTLFKLIGLGLEGQRSDWCSELESGARDADSMWIRARGLGVGVQGSCSGSIFGLGKVLKSQVQSQGCFSGLSSEAPPSPSSRST